MIQPIPKRMLKDIVNYSSYNLDSGEGASYGTPTLLSNVKVEEKKVFYTAQDGNEVVGNAVLFYDYVNSKGLIGEFKNQSKIGYNGRTYHIVDTETLRGNSTKPHHYEVLLK